MKNKQKIFKYLFYLLTFCFICVFSYAEESYYKILGNKVIYQNDSNLIIAKGEATIEDKSGKKISADEISYDKNKFLIRTKNNSLYTDLEGNKLYADIFEYNVKLKTIDANSNVKYIDSKGNVFKFSSLKFYENLNKGIGKNLVARLIDKSTFEGNFAEFDNNNQILTIGEDKKEGIFNKLKNLFNNKKNYYTPCDLKTEPAELISNSCPDWSFESNKTVHDRVKKRIYHYGSILRIKNFPVFYTPFFFHPDSSAKRESGLLFPTLKNHNNLGQSIKTPYFWAINKNSDLTFSPIYYFEENPIFLAEFRNQGDRSKFYLETSYTKGYKNLLKKDDNNENFNRTSGSRNHIFLNFLGSYENLLFNQNDLEINIQRVSQKNYLNVNEINTSFVKQDINDLKNDFIINSYEDNKRLSLKFGINEKLSIDEKNNKYQYIFPSIQFSNFFNRFDQQINLKSSFESKNIGGDSNQIYQKNYIETSSQPSKFLFDGVFNTFKTAFNNVNLYNQNISNMDENFNGKFYLTGAIETIYPLIKIQDNNEKIITPTIFTKFTSGSMVNANSKNKILNINDINSLNRIDDETIVETGSSIGYSIDFNDIHKNNKNETYLKKEFSIGQIFRTEKNNEMPNNSTLKEKRSGFVGNAEISYDVGIEHNEKNINKINLKYDYVISKNFNQIYKNNIVATYQNNKNTLNVNFYEINTIGNEHSINAQYSRKLTEETSFIVGGKKNLKENFSENNYIGMEYETDCIKLNLNLAKSFYNNEDIKPSNTLSFSLILKPFGTATSQNLSSFFN